MKPSILLFPGQGSQCKGMGRDIAEHDSESMELWKKAESISKLPLREIFWEGDEIQMRSTSALQPALTVVNCTLWKASKEKVSILGASGHSLGEFSALACAHVLSFDDALELTSVRGSLMEQADPTNTGAMAAVVKLDCDTVLEIVSSVCAQTGEVLVCANFNTPLQTVISGTKTALECATKKIKEKKGRAVPLQVSAAFHSPMMEEANAEFIPCLEKVSWHDAQYPIFCNVDGKPETRAALLLAGLKKQMVSPVRWVDTIRNQYAASARFWLELGPKSILAKMVGQCLSPSDEYEEIATAAVTDLESACHLAQE